MNCTSSDPDAIVCSTAGQGLPGVVEDCRYTLGNSKQLSKVFGNCGMWSLGRIHINSHNGCGSLSCIYMTSWLEKKNSNCCSSKHLPMVKHYLRMRDIYTSFFFFFLQFQCTVYINICPPQTTPPLCFYFSGENPFMPPDEYITQLIPPHTHSHSQTHILYGHRMHNTYMTALVVTSSKFANFTNVAMWVHVIGHKFGC